MAGLQPPPVVRLRGIDRPHFGLVYGSESFLDVAIEVGSGVGSVGILANPKRFGLEEGENMVSEAWEMAKDMGKADTALQFAIREQDWVAPRYIREGLAWLAEPPSPPAEPPPAVPQKDGGEVTGFAS